MDMSSISADVELVPSDEHFGSVAADAWARMSRLLDIRVENALDLARINREGVPPEVVEVLVDRGLTRRELDWIAPSRTLSHRRQKGERLKAGETGCFLRALKILVMAETVLGGRENALAWLRKSRRAFGGMSAIELIRTEAGGQLAEENLIQLDEGYFA